MCKQLDEIPDNMDTEQLDRRALLDSLTGSVWLLASKQHGTYVVQRAFRIANADERAEMAKELHGHVKEAWQSLYAVFVLEICIELMPPSSVEFIIEEMLEEMEASGKVEAALHPQGIRVIQRLVEHCLIEQSTEVNMGRTKCPVLVDKIIENTSELVNHKFGNFVLQWVLDYGIADQPTRVVDSLAQCGVLELAERSPACHVLEKALEISTGEQRDLLAGPLRSNVPRLKKHPVGSWVIKCMRRLQLLPREAGMPPDGAPAP
jgi:pumilio RNA-binding family